MKMEGTGDQRRRKEGSKRYLDDDLLKAKRFQAVAGALKELMKNPIAAEVVRTTCQGLFFLLDNPEGLQTLIGAVSQGFWPRLEDKG